MIRNYVTEDLGQLHNIISKEVIGIDLDTIRNIQSGVKNFLIWDEAGIKGFAYMIESNKEKHEWRIQLYVDPQERRKGIGTALYHEIQRQVEVEKPSVLVTEFRVDIDDPAHFYERFGYKKWYGSPDMHYRGTTQEGVNISFVNYEDKYYEQYAKCRQDCFYEIRKQNDIQPYIRPLNDEDRKNILSEKDSIYLAFDNECLVGAIKIKGGYLDLVMVSPSYQGKGYGKKITQFGINKALREGQPLIQLCYMEGNKRAENLYKSLGFEIVQNTHAYRKFMNL